MLLAKVEKDPQVVSQEKGYQEDDSGVLEIENSDHDIVEIQKVSNTSIV